MAIRKEIFSCILVCKDEVSGSPKVSRFPELNLVYFIKFAGVVQRLVCEFSKLEIGVRFPAPAPNI